MADTFRKGLASRVAIIALVIILLFASNIGRLFYLQIAKGEEYAEKAKSRSFQTER